MLGCRNGLHEAVAQGSIIDVRKDRRSDQRSLTESFYSHELIVYPKAAVLEPTIELIHLVYYDIRRM